MIVKAAFLLVVAAATGSLMVRPMPAAAPQVQAAADAATLKGSVKIKGEIPKRGKIPVNADPKCAAMHVKDPLLTDEVVTDAAGNVQWAFVSVKGGLGEQKFVAPKTPSLVEQKGCRFEPHVLGIMAGQELMFRNQDALMHIVHVVPKNNKEFGFSQVRQGEERPKVFTGKETIRLFCDVHPWMVAWIMVLDHPLYTVTGPDGKFKMKGLPPGKYTIEAWHEGYKPVTQEIEVKAKDSKTLNFEFTDRQ